MKRLIAMLSFLILGAAIALSGQNGKLTLFGGVQTFGSGGGAAPDPQWKPINQGSAAGTQFPANWWRDQWQLNFFNYFDNYGSRFSPFQPWWQAAHNWCAANGVNGPCIQLLYPLETATGATVADYIAWLQQIAPYIPAGTYEIAANEVLNSGKGEPSHAVLDALGGTGATGYDGLIALIKLLRQYLPGIKLGINDFSVCDYSGYVPGPFFNGQPAINAYKVLSQNGATLDWLGCEGYWFNTTLTTARVEAQINNIGSQLVTTAGVGAPNTIAFTEFTPKGGGGPMPPQYAAQQALWQAMLSMFASNQYVFGVTGPWGSYRKSGAYDQGNWLWNDLNDGSLNPDGTTAAVTPTLTWLQGWASANVQGSASSPVPTPTPVPSPTPASSLGLASGVYAVPANTLIQVP